MKIEHKFFENGLTAFVYDLKDVLTYPKSDLPVSIKNTGDEVYLLDLQKSMKNDEIYEKVPRVDLVVSDVLFDYTGITNPNVLAKFNLKTVIGNIEQNRKFRAKVRRIPTKFTIQVKLISANFLESLKWLDIITMLLTKDRTFSFLWADYSQYATYSLSGNFNIQKNLQLSFDPNRRHHEIIFDIDIKFQFPALDIYGRANSNGINDLTGKNSQDSDGLSMVPDDRRIRQWTHNTILSPTNTTETIYVPDEPATSDDPNVF